MPPFFLVFELLCVRGVTIIELTTDVGIHEMTLRASKAGTLTQHGLGADIATRGETVRRAGWRGLSWGDERTQV